MKVVFCIFSYETDLPLLRRSLDSIGRLKALYPEHEILTALVNDLNLPIPDKDIPVVDILKTTTWKRGFNLTHIENIFGQLRVYSDLVKETNADVVIKMDSDTMMSRLDWLDIFVGENAPSMFGTCISKTSTQIFGYYYGMTPDVIEAMNSLINDESIACRIRDTREGWVLEDRIYTCLAQMAHARKLCNGVHIERLDIHECAKNLLSTVSHRTSLIGTQWLKKHSVPIERYRDMIAVTFKRRGKSEDIISEALEGMNAFWEVLKDHPRFVDKSSRMNVEEL